MLDHAPKFFIYIPEDRARGLERDGNDKDLDGLAAGL